MKKDNLKKLFLFCLGLFIASAFAMKWIEGDLMFNNEKISIFGLELFYSKERIMDIMKGIDDKTRTILRYHLSFDFVFMIGCYPGIAILCIMALSKKILRIIKALLLTFAFLQIIAWVCDIFENYFLLKWMNSPVIGNEFGHYHVIVYSKWIIALSGFLIAVITLITNAFLKKKSGVIERAN